VGVRYRQMSKKSGVTARPAFDALRVTAVTSQDRRRWDERYASRQPPPDEAIRPPGLFADYADAFPRAGHGLDLACGQGFGSVWLARRGLDVRAFDVSAIAIDQARELARRNGVADRCRFDVVDLDDGLPAGPPADVILSHKFRDSRLDRAIIARLAPSGLLAIAALSEVGGVPGRFRATPGELAAAFAELDVVAAGEGGGHAWLLARA
jgi:2-polyprenyl-3-methyl-5-hydroxy-6-metoxy-1,4-benzoquinol methylase